MQIATEVGVSMSGMQRAVPQEHGLGCAVACVAFRCRITYARALEYFSVREQAWSKGYLCSEIVEALGRAGLRYAFSAFEARTSSPLLEREGTIAFVESCPAYPVGHYLIRAGERWMNSWTNFPRMIPVEAGFQEDLPGKISYVIYEV